ncbi:MAG: hypothetical protein ACK400_18210 [Pseudanabaena sp.]
MSGEAAPLIFYLVARLRHATRLQDRLYGRLEVPTKRISSFFVAIALNKRQTLLHQC